MNDLEVLNAMWLGAQLTGHMSDHFADAFSLHPRGADSRVVSQQVFRSLVQRKFIRKSGWSNWVLTDLGLQALGKPTTAEASRVEVTGPDIRRTGRSKAVRK